MQRQASPRAPPVLTEPDLEMLLALWAAFLDVDEDEPPTFLVSLDRAREQEASGVFSAAGRWAVTHPLKTEPR